MDTTIFCPNCQRFIGPCDKCEHCHWVRPAQPSSLGRIKWKARLGAEEPVPGMPSFPARITASDDLLFIPTENGDVVALDAETGQIAWRRTIRPDRKLRTNAVAVWRDVILIGAENLVELPSRDRELLAWRTTTGEDAWTWPTTDDSLSIPLVHQDVAYFSSSEPQVYAFDLVTRRLRWVVPALPWSSDPPAISGEVIVVPSHGPEVAAYSLENGKRLWTFGADDKQNESLHYQPAVTSDTAYLAGWGKRVYAVDVASGRLRWRFEVERGFTCAPILASNKILLGVKDYRLPDGDRKPGYCLYALDAASGQLAWQFRTDKHIYISPAVSGDMILLGADHRRLHVLDACDGHEVWQMSFQEKLRAGPCVLGDHVAAGQRNGDIICVQWKVGPPARLPPDALLNMGKPLEAAESFALQGDYQAAARLFAEHSRPQYAAALYLEANLLDKAAEIYAQQQDLDTAVDLYRRTGNRRGEADVLALQEKHAEAAPLYEGIGNLDLAVREYIAADRVGYAAQLLRKAGRKQEAARLYRSLNQDDLAAETRVEAGDYRGAAEAFQRMGKPEVAAGVLAQGGLLAEAATLHEQIGHSALAADLYAQAGQVARALALYEELQDWKHAAELAEATHDLPRLADALTRLGQTARAAQMYEQAGLLERALGLYESLAQWGKVEQIAGRLEQWGRQARALSQIGLVSQAGEAYERAAEQLQARTPEATEELALVYEAAARCYAEDENTRRYRFCRDKVCQYRQLPNLIGQFELGGPFYQDEFNEVRIVVRNVGYSPARNVLVVGTSSKFSLDVSEHSAMAARITALAPQQDKTIVICLKPQSGALGRVMLYVTLGYLDMAGQKHKEEFIQRVEVVGRDEKLAAIGRQIPAAVTPPGGATAEDRLTESVQERLRSEMSLKLYDVLMTYFSDNELRDLCFRLSISYENLPGEGKAAKARELVAYHERRSLVSQLVEILHELRPNAQW
jgi:outer membrane protein assembly factor BamB/tetratricopeptide (TPR) repeat protein